MPSKRIFIILIILALSGSLYSQSQLYNTKEVIRLSDKADKYLTEYKFKESLFFSREALKQAIYLKDNYLIATAYNTIAGNFDELMEPDKAIHNYQKALFYAKRTANDSIIGWINNNLGNIYFFEKKEYSKGIFYYNRSIEFAEKNKDTARIVFTKINFAWGYFNIKNFDEGKKHLDYVNKYYKKYDDYTSLPIIMMLNGMYSSHVGDLKMADKYFLSSIALAKTNHIHDDLSYSYEEYSKFLMRKGDYKGAYNYLSMYGNIKNEIYAKDKIKGGDIEGVNLEIDEYKRALNKIEAEKKFQSLKLHRSRTVVVLFIIGICILLILLYTLFINNRFRKKMNLELTEANHEMKQAIERAEEASRLKSQFVSTISHELRTPLYGVVGITNMILDEHKELAGSAHLNALKFSANYLLSLVNDILQINKIEENRLMLESQLFNLVDEINAIKNSLQFIATRNNDKITLEIDTDIPELIIGDKLRLSQIFMNLVSNALKFTKNGEVIIAAHLDRVEAMRHFIKFTVKDNGIGIAKIDHDKIFDKFVQIERKNDDYQGTGLGLSIVKRLISVFESEIFIESEENKGTEFTFTIGFIVDPLRTAEIINDMEVDISNGQIFSILVVEDNKINQIVTKKTIESNHYSCTIADDGYSALEILADKSFDVILMDINMPGMNGFETTRKIRESGNNVPIIALTAFGKDEIAEEALSSGMNDIIIKPFEAQKLFRIMSELIAKSKNAG